MQYSAEVRWFPGDGNLIKTIILWFNERGKFFSGQHDRFDLYLQLEDLPTLGIKIREGRLEVKVQQQDLGQVSIPGTNSGIANTWCKYGFNLENENEDAEALIAAFANHSTVGSNRHWIRIDKERLLIRYSINPEKEIIKMVDGNEEPALGCNVEMTKLTVNHQKEYYTFAIETVGEEAQCKMCLGMAVTEIFSGGKIEGLTVESSLSYPAFLRNILTY